MVSKTITIGVVGIIILGLLIANTNGIEWKLAQYKDESPLFFGFSPEGTANDNTYMYWSGDNTLRKTNQAPEMRYETVKVNYDPLKEFKSLGYNHIGDVDYDFNTQVLFAPVEEPTYTKPAFIPFETSDLNPLGNIYVLNQSHCPWVAVDNEAEVFFSSEYNNVTYIYVYKLNPATNEAVQLAPLFLSATGPEDSTNISQILPPGGCQDVTGGVVRGGLLYLSTNYNNGREWRQPVHIFNTTTGVLVQAFNAARDGAVGGITLTGPVSSQLLEHLFLVENTNPLWCSILQYKAGF